MSTSSLLETMTQEVENERVRIVDSARAEAARLLAEAQAEAGRRRDRAVADATAELAEAAQRSRERAEAEAEMIVLTTKDTITDEILSAVAQELDRVVEQPGFPAILEALLEEALADTPLAEVVLAPPEHVERCRQWLADHGHEALEVRGKDSLPDGIALQDLQRSFRVTNTLSARLDHQEGRLRKLCLTRLLPGEQPE